MPSTNESSTTNRPRFSGVIPPIVTPMTAADQLDLDGIDRVVDHLVGGGVHGIFALGTTGEGPSLTYQMRYEMAERVCARAAGRIPVLICVTDTCLAESAALAEHAANAGATAIVAAAPSYFAATQSQLVDWFRSLADRSSLPLMLYNMPGCVHVDLELSAVVQLADHPNIVGIKDSSGDMLYFRGLCETFGDREDFVVFMGPEERLAEAVSLGAAGGVCGGANLLPAVYVGLFNAAQANNAPEVARLQAVVDTVFRQIYRDSSGVMNLIPALKLAMQYTGLCDRIVAPPLKSPDEPHARQIAESELLVALSCCTTDFQAR